MKLICNRDGCTEPATHQGYIGNPPVIVALCKVHAIENAIKRQQEGAAEPAPINYDNFTIASTTDGLVLWYDGDSFTLDSEMERQLIDYLKPKYNEALIQQGKCISCQDKDCDVWITADQTCWKSSKEHDAAIVSAAIQQDREKWRNGHTDELIWMTPEEEERRIIKDEQIRIRNAVSAIKKLDDYIKSLEPAHGLYLVSAPMVRNELKDILAIVDGKV